MDYEDVWIFVDDAPLEAEAFAAQLRDAGIGKIEVMSPADARVNILSALRRPAGVLMDVDLSAAAGETGTGPGIAQDIRVKQKSRKVLEFPVVRFASLPRVLDNVTGDPSSDDLFDLKIQKEEVKGDIENIIQRLRGVREIYDVLESFSTGDENAVESILDCTLEQASMWGHEGFNSRLMSSFTVSSHVSAAVIIRSFIMPIGLLIDENALAIRLGVDALRSGVYWSQVLECLDFKFTGIASDYFPRWWARGLEDWWYSSISTKAPLVGLEISERCRLLQEGLNIKGLVPLLMPDGSPGECPWRMCALSLEHNPASIVPVDPMYGVRFTPRIDIPVWVDPMQVSLKEAMQNKYDYRLNRSDLVRIPAKVK